MTLSTIMLKRNLGKSD